MNNKSKHEFIQIFSHNIKFLREKNNLSKNQMRKILGITSKSLEKIENGILPPKLSANVVFKVQNYFDVPASVVVGEKLK